VNPSNTPNLQPNPHLISIPTPLRPSIPSKADNIPAEKPIIYNNQFNGHAFPVAHSADAAIAGKITLHCHDGHCNNVAMN
jgi:hypothetical protein